jgi:hypothetical protein
MPKKTRPTELPSEGRLSLIVRVDGGHHTLPAGGIPK